MAFSSLLLDRLPDPLLELALSLLPLPSLISAAASNTHLRRLISSAALSSPDFHQHHRSPWFFFLGQNRLLPYKSQFLAFDPISNAWFRIPFPTTPPHNQSSLASSSNLLFALQGALQDKLCICLSPKYAWEAIAVPMSVPRASPLAVAAVGNYLVVAGGGDTDADADPGAVEIFDRGVGAWRAAEPLPEPLHQSCIASSSVTCNGRLYVADCYSGAMAWMDPAEGKWTAGMVERPESAIWWSLVAVDMGSGNGRRQQERLVAVVLCSREGGGVKMMEVDEETMQLRGELGTMPAELLRKLSSSSGDREQEMEVEKHIQLRCSGGGPGIVYIYSPSPFVNYPLILCKLSPSSSSPSSTGCSWHVPPPLPPPVNRFDRVLCFSAAMPVASFISTPHA